MTFQVGGHRLDGVVGLDVRAPVGAANANVGYRLARADDARVGGLGLAALSRDLLGDLGGDHVVAGIHARPKAVHDGVEEARGARLEDGVAHDDAVCLGHLEEQPVEVILVDAHVALAAHEHLHAGDAARAVLDVEVHRADELDLAALFDGTHQRFLADAVVVAVLGSKRDAQNLCHGAPAFRHGFAATPPRRGPSDGRSLSPEMLCNCIEDWPRNALSLSREGHRRPPRPRRAPPGRVP